MVTTSRLYRLFIAIVLVGLSGCAISPPVPVISDLNPDKAVIQYVSRYGEEPDPGLIDVEARKGCAIHGKKPVFVSATCKSEHSGESFTTCTTPSTYTTTHGYGTYISSAIASCITTATRTTTCSHLYACIE